ncbi:MAG: thiol-disulfide oxidoreductase DCC family protein [Bradymonadia bacterium]
MLKTSDYDEPFEVFYDGGCRLCVTEINLLRRLDRRQRIIFTDIGDPKFSAVDETGLSYVELMVRIHGRYASGQLIEGVEVFRQLYARTLFRPLVPLSRIPGLRALLDRCYVFFAQWRFKSRGGACAPDGTCRIELPDTAQP